MMNMARIVDTRCHVGNVYMIGETVQGPASLLKMTVLHYTEDHPLSFIQISLFAHPSRFVWK